MILKSRDFEKFVILKKVVILKKIRDFENNVIFWEKNGDARVIGVSREQHMSARVH